MTRGQAQQYAKPGDAYAFARCGCKHIVYADDQPGGRCRWNYVGMCDCVDHRTPADSAQQEAAR